MQSSLQNRTYQMQSRNYRTTIKNQLNDIINLLKTFSYIYTSSEIDELRTEKRRTSAWTITQMLIEHHYDQLSTIYSCYAMILFHEPLIYKQQMALSTMKSRVYIIIRRIEGSINQKTTIVWSLNTSKTFAFNK